MEMDFWDEKFGDWERGEDFGIGVFYRVILRNKSMKFVLTGFAIIYLIENFKILTP